MEYRKNEIRAGVFLFVSFAVFVVMIFAVSDVKSLFKKKKDVKALFHFSEGIEKNAQVRYSGIKVGKVTGVRVAHEHGDRIEITLSVYRDTDLKEDSKAAIKTLGLVGGKYVELSGGTPEAGPLEPGQYIVGQESMKIEDLTKAGIEVALKLKNIANNLNEMLGDPRVAKSVKATVENVQELTANLKTITSAKEEIGKGLRNLPEIIKKLEESTANLKAITEKADNIVAENRKQIDAMIENVKEMTANLKDASAEVKKAPWKLLRKP